MHSSFYTAFRLSIMGLTALALTSCGKKESPPHDTPSVSSSFPTYSILLSSELKDMEPTLQSCAQQAKIQLQSTYVGSLDAVDQLQSGSWNLAWLSNNRFARLIPSVNTSIERSDKIMQSAVVVGIRPEALEKHPQWKHSVTWKALLESVSKGQINVAMTNPVASNSGFSGLMALASAVANKGGDALTQEDLQRPEVKTALQSWMQGVTLTSGSSGDLLERWNKNPQAADLVVMYDANLQSSPIRLVTLTPQEGVVIADYPLMKLKSKTKNPAFDQSYSDLLQCLKSPTVQNGPVRSTFRNTPLQADVVDVPFPDRIETVEYVLNAIRNEYSKPAVSYWVMDTSLSMEDQGRIDDLKESLIQLLSHDQGMAGRFSTFKDRETIRLVTFDERVIDRGTVTFEQSRKKEQTERLAQDIRRLKLGNGTSIYSGLLAVYADAAKIRKEGRPVNIVLMTDGENNSGASEAEFLDEVNRIQAATGIRVPVLTVLYGDANPSAMKTIVSSTDGVLIDARQSGLIKAMKTVRTYQ